MVEIGCGTDLNFRYLLEALASDGRLVILDFKLPEKWPLWLIRVFALLAGSFGVTLDLAERKPWEAMQKYFAAVRMNEICGGLLYTAVGTNAHNAGTIG